MILKNGWYIKSDFMSYLLSIVNQLIKSEKNLVIES